MFKFQLKSVHHKQNNDKQIMNCLIILNFGAFFITTMASSEKYLPPILKQYTNGEYNINLCNNKGDVHIPHLCPPIDGPKNIEKKSIYAIPPPPNPLVEALLLSNTLNIAPKSLGYNHLDMLPLNPYLALLLSHYGQYLPIYGKGRGLYGYTAANNYHNNKPFGAYKVYEDNDS